MEEILHQLTWQISHYLQGFRHPRWLVGFLPSTVSQKQRQQRSETKESFVVSNILDTLPPYLSFVFKWLVFQRQHQSAWFKSMYVIVIVVLVAVVVLLLWWGWGLDNLFIKMPSTSWSYSKIPGLDASDLILFFDDNHVHDEVPLSLRGRGITWAYGRPVR